MKKSYCLLWGSLAVAGGLVTASQAQDVLNAQKGPLDPPSLNMRAMQLRDADLPRTSGTEFNPAISLIIDFTYTHNTDDLEAPAGFELGAHSHGHGEEDHSHHDEEHGHSHGLEDGFQIRAVELNLSATVDPYFDAQTTIHFSDDDVEVEEAFITSRMLPSGLQLKAGKFLSDVGYINKQHAHDWLFVDSPWIQEYFFGDEGLNELGVQLSWLPPTETYIRLGAEALQGDSEGIASYIGEDGLSEKDSPRLFTGFAKIAPDLGSHHAVQYGAFGGVSRAFQLEQHEEEYMDGDAWFAGLDFVYKYNGQGSHGHRNFALQAEYIYRQIELDPLGGHSTHEEHAHEEEDHHHEDHHEDHHDEGHGHHGQEWKQDGLYVQAVYGFAPRWNAGLRYDVLGLVNDGYDHDEKMDFGTSYRYTGQLTYAPTEFSRFRAQAAYTELADSGHEADHAHDGWQFVLQYTVSLGAHGAHAF